MVKGKFNGHAYFLCLLIMILLIISFWMFFQPYLKLKGKAGIDLPAPWVGLIFLALSAFVFYTLSKVIFWIAIDSNFISLRGVFKKKLISRSEIKEIDLFSKEDFYWSAGRITVGTKIELQDGQTFVIADPFYRNINMLKQALVNNFEEKVKSFKRKKQGQFIQTDLINHFEKFSGNPYTSANGITFFVVAIMPFLILNKKDLETGYLFFIPIVILLYLAFGSQMNYFLISNTQFIIKNHFYFWRNRNYKIDDIIQANIETQNKRSDALRITTNDFRSRAYSAGSLRPKHWIALREKLERLGIYFV